MIYIVYGAPCSGKTTYVKERIKSNDIVWDWDAIESAFSGRDYQDKNPNINLFIKKVRRLFIDECLVNKVVNDKWIIATNINGKLIEELELVDQVMCHQMETSEDECVRRLNQTERKDKEELLDVIEDWYRKHEEWW